MTREEYEARRRRLDEELRSAVELLKQGHQAQVQMLDLLWKTSTGGAATPEAPQPAAPPPPPPEPPRRKRGPGALLDELIDLLPRLPETFSKDDVERSLAEPADRASLLRAFRTLQREGWLRVENFGMGRHPTVYRQTRPSSRASAPEPRNAGEPS